MYNRTVALARLSKGDTFLASAPGKSTASVFEHKGLTDEEQVLARVRDGGAYAVFCPTTTVKIDSSVEPAPLWCVSDNDGGLGVERDDEMVDACGLLDKYNDLHASLNALAAWAACEGETEANALGQRFGLDKAGPEGWSPGEALLGSALVTLMLNLPTFQSGSTGTDRARAWDALLGPEEDEKDEDDEKDEGGDFAFLRTLPDYTMRCSGPKLADLNPQVGDVIGYKMQTRSGWAVITLDEKRGPTEWLGSVIKTVYDDKEGGFFVIHGGLMSTTYFILDKKMVPTPKAPEVEGWEVVWQGSGPIDWSTVRLGDMVAYEGFSITGPRPWWALRQTVNGMVPPTKEFVDAGLKAANAIKGEFNNIYYAVYRQRPKGFRVDDLQLGDQCRLRPDDAPHKVISITNTLLADGSVVGEYRLADVDDTMDVVTVAHDTLVYGI